MTTPGRTVAFIATWIREPRSRPPAMAHPTDRPLVSILVNNRNYARHVCGATRSALDQTWPRVEVIVVDDGSTDDSLERLATLDDPRLTVVAQPNLGQGGAYNAGWSRCRGEFVIFLDSDDLLDRDVVERCVGAFDADTAKVQFALRVVDGNGMPTGGVHPPELDDDGSRDRVLRFGNYASPPGSGNCYAAWYLRRVMPIEDVEDMRIGSDAWCILMAPFHGRIRSLSSPGGCYRVDRPSGVDALRVIGNVGASPARNVTRHAAATRVVFGALKRDGLVDADEPVLPSPPLLRAWLLARLQGEPVPADVMWGPAPGVTTLLRSVAGWRAYGLRKRLVYAVYLLTLRYLPSGLARSTVRAAARVVS